MKKRILALTLCLVMLFSFTSTALATDSQNDLPFENSAFFDYEDYTLHYRTYEPAQEPLNQIMLIHGFCLSTASFEDLAEQYVKNGYRVVLVDAPNFGYSSRETTDMLLLDREELVYELMSSLSDKTWIVGGHSMGGGIAMNIAIDYPESVSGLVLFSAQTSQDATPLTSMLMSSQPFTKLFDIILGFALRIPFVIDTLVEQSFSDATFARRYDDDRISDPLSLDGTGAGICIMSSHTRGTDFEKFSELTVPTAIITSSNDQIAMPANTAQILESKPANAFTKEVTKGGHMIMEYNAEYAYSLTIKTVRAAEFADIG